MSLSGYQVITETKTLQANTAVPQGFSIDCYIVVADA